jgi:hypothetical protein
LSPLGRLPRPYRFHGSIHRRVNFLIRDPTGGAMPIDLIQRAADIFHGGPTSCIVRCLSSGEYHHAHLLIGLERLTEQIFE